ncbi:MAG: methionine--tRNA ligase, partial [Candidatus Rokuibacteriota bacterium]
VVQRILTDLHDRGEIYFGEYGGHYCYGCERFYTDKEIIDGKCPDHQTALTYIKEKNYFFRMSAYQERLIRHLEEYPDFIQPDRYRNEVLGFLREPLQDLSISRPRSRVPWGIPLPFDEDYVTYVWFDALLNYVSALGYPDDERYRAFWPEAIHLIGKDILKPHGVYWPAMLWAANLPLYRGLRVHGFWSVEGRKMSKSLGNVVGAYTLADKYGREALRYFVLREMNFGLDADFSEEAFVGRLNADLANDLGNLVSRATTLIVTFGRGVVPSPGPEGADEAVLRAALRTARADVDAAMAEFAFQRALASVWEFIGCVNRYVDTQAPWTLAKDPAAAGRLGTVLWALAESLRCLGILLEPFLPEAAAKIRAGIGAPAPRLADLEWGGLAAGGAVQKVPGLFPRVDMKAPLTPPSPQRGEGDHMEKTTIERITMSDFQKVDLRVAEVVAAERLPKSKKLLKLTVKVDGEPRTVVAGIAESYAPESLLGRKVVVVANLEPATLMGVQSNGMVLAGSHEGTVSLLLLDKDLPAGSKVK